MRTLPVWNPVSISTFLQNLKYYRRDVAGKYGMAVEHARNIFVNRRVNVTILQLRKMEAVANHEESFVPCDANDDGMFYPERDDIVTFDEKTMLGLTRYEERKNHSIFVGVILTFESDGVIAVCGEKITAAAQITMATVCPYMRKSPVLLDKAMGMHSLQR